MSEYRAILVSRRPFSCGSQFMDWESSNCVGCAKYDPDGMGSCEISDALLCAYLDTGDVSDEIADRMGHVDIVPGPYGWRCPEREEAAS